MTPQLVSNIYAALSDKTYNKSVSETLPCI